MFQLYKSRDFGAYFQDTFTFLKLNAKHFFKNFFIVNGIFLLILVTMWYYFYKVYEDIVINGMLLNRDSSAITTYFDENLVSIVIYGSLGLFLLIIVSVFNYAYVPIYFKLYDKHRGQNFDSKEIFDELKANIAKLIIFILACIPVGIVTLIAAMIVGFVISITIIGIPFLLFLGAIIALFFHATLMEYINTDKGVFECFSYGFNMCFQKFFHAMGAIVVFFIIIFVFQMIVGIIQMVITTILGITSLSDPNAAYQFTEENWSFQFILLLIFQLFSYLINLTTSAISQMNQAIIYYSLKEEKENIHTQSTIDEIGQGE
ncbi:hypothetical protein [Kordia jejudonensis]|uniref:hypothetical protein n=1 Tax=Kordia jejudonensis TaxID=1348245 RepID=UPI0006294FA3|nr:hypothetical protein [Kordia jejudonensis]